MAAQDSGAPIEPPIGIVPASGRKATSACRTGLPVVNADPHENAERWPRFAEAAASAGYVSVHVLPLRLRETVIGALNLFVAAPRILSPGDIRLGQALGDAATMGILAQRGIAQAELLATQLQTALNSRVIFEQAKGVLAERGRPSPSLTCRIRHHVLGERLGVD